MKKGRVRLFNEIVGTGFVETDDSTEILKFSYRDINRLGYRILHEGQRVLFDVKESSRGILATNIIPADIKDR